MVSLERPSTLGSSPRMRGAHQAGHHRHRVKGIIPAYAGSTNCCKPVRLAYRDHPRVCGEHFPRVEAIGDYKGSSPRMRGAHKPHLHAEGVEGIIPAYAGSTSGSRWPSSPTGDHPRVCGEHAEFAVDCAVDAGSSPRMRGAPGPGLFEGSVGGIIPAYAGSTRATSRPSAGTWDHPRVCGEHYGKTGFGAFLTGSSPRMRGARFADRVFAAYSGIIPAYAGSTQPSRPPVRAGRDHPRVCGEHDALE